MRKISFTGQPVGCPILYLLLFLLCASSGCAQSFHNYVSSPAAHLAPNATVSVRELSISWDAREDYKHGLQRLAQGDAAASVPFFEKAIKKYADYYEAYYHLGVAQARLGLNDRAIVSFQSSIDLSRGSYALPQFAYALLLCQQGKPAEAELIVRTGLKLDQHKPFGEIVLGTVLVDLHRFDEAAQTARDALRDDASAADAYLILASVDNSKDDYDQEVRDLDAFLRINPDSPRRQQVRDIRAVAQHLAEKGVGKDNTSAH